MAIVKLYRPTGKYVITTDPHYYGARDEREAAFVATHIARRLESFIQSRGYDILVMVERGEHRIEFPNDWYSLPALEEVIEHEKKNWTTWTNIAFEAYRQSQR